MAAGMNALHRLTIGLGMACMLLASPSNASAIQDSGKPTEETADNTEEVEAAKQELEELGATLRAAVMSGAMTGEEAKRIYMAVETSLRNEAGESIDKTEAWMNTPKARTDPKARVLRLSVPKVGQVRALVRPEFQRADLTILRNELRLDSDQMAIIEATFDSYAEAFELAAEPLRDSLRRYHRTRRDEWVASSLNRARPVRSEDAVRRTRQALQETEEKMAEAAEEMDEDDRAKMQERLKGLQRIAASAGELDQRLAEIREQSRARLAEANRDGVKVTVNDVIRNADEFRHERDRLSASFIEVVQLVAMQEGSDKERARMDRAVARIRIEGGLDRGRLGGESMNLWEAARIAGLPAEAQATVLDRLNRDAEAIAYLVEERKSATMDREIRGLEYMRTRDRADADAESRAAAANPMVAANRRELMTSVAVRDALYSLLDRSSAQLRNAYPGTEYSDQYRDAALRDGFPAETRRRWCERAIDSALELIDLNSSTRESLVAIQRQNEKELRALREEAISRCMTRDPKLARGFIETTYGNTDREMEWVPEMWLGINHEAFDYIDERTASELRAILTPEQLAELPKAPGDKTNVGARKDGRRR